MSFSNTLPTCNKWRQDNPRHKKLAADALNTAGKDPNLAAHPHLVIFYNFQPYNWSLLLPGSAEAKSVKSHFLARSFRKVKLVLGTQLLQLSPGCTAVFR